METKQISSTQFSHFEKKKIRKMLRTLDHRLEVSIKIQF